MIVLDERKDCYIDTETKIIYPRVSLILKESGVVNTFFYDEISSQFGKIIHMELEFLDSPTGIEIVDRHKEQFKRFLEDYNVRIESREQIVFHEVYRYAGRYDLVVDIDGKKWLIDVKTSKSEQKWWGVQLAAYDLVLKLKNRAALILNEDRYKFIPYKDRNDYNVFKACLTIYNFKYGKGGVRI